MHLNNSLEIFFLSSSSSLSTFRCVARFHGLSFTFHKKRSTRLMSASNVSSAKRDVNHKECSSRPTSSHKSAPNRNITTRHCLMCVMFSRNASDLVTCLKSKIGDFFLRSCMLHSRRLRCRCVLHISPSESTHNCDVVGN